MENAKQLLVGIDFGNEITQISCFDRKSFEPVPVGVEDAYTGEMQYEIPSSIKWMPSSGIWRLLCQKGDGSKELVIEHILSLSEKETVEIEGQVLQVEEIIEQFLLKLLHVLHVNYAQEKIEQLVITVPEKQSGLMEKLQQAGKNLGIWPQRMTIQNYRLSYMYYAISQPKELWLNNVGLFSFDRQGLVYWQINIDRRTLPWIVGVQEKNLTDLLEYSMLDDPQVDSSYAFVTTAGSVLHKQMVTTLYVTGEAFEGDWAEDALQQLCDGRRVFRGQNIYTKGACYGARELAGEGKLEQCMLLDEDMITANVSLRVYHDAQMQDLVVAKAGSVWNEIDVSVDVIPDKEYEIQVTAQDVIKHQTSAHMLSLSGFTGRENKTTRFTVRIRFANRETCIVTLKDNGFGEVSPTSNRIWERCIKL